MSSILGEHTSLEDLKNLQAYYLAEIERRSQSSDAGDMSQEIDAIYLEIENLIHERYVNDTSKTRKLQIDEQLSLLQKKRERIQNRRGIKVGRLLSIKADLQHVEHLIALKEHSQIKE